MERQLDLATPETKLDIENIEWSQLLEEALTMPGQLGNTYNRFYNYSFNNQILLYLQGVTEPVNTFKRWNDMNRRVKKGSKAKSILRPITVKLDELDDEGQPKTFTRFKLVRCLFTASETEGDPLPEYEPAEWNPTRALGALAIREVAFESLDGNAQGFSRGQELAINPVAAYPLKTLTHEVGHIVLGHTTPQALDDYQQHRGVKEFQAESTAYLTMNEIGASDDHWNPAESRGYISHWLKGQQPEDKHIREVFKATDTILKAGRE